jgi:hypothetical protein
MEQKVEIDMNLNTWEMMKYNNAFEIMYHGQSDEIPASIRRISDGFEPTIRLCKRHGYYTLSLDGSTVNYHRVIAVQWVYNDDPVNKTCTDHISRNRIDNRVENLRWLSCSGIQLNRGQKYVDLLPDNVIPLLEYNHFKYSRYYYCIDDSTLYYDVPDFDQWMIVKELNNGNVNLKDVYGKFHQASWKKLQRYFDGE